jgi:large subunit ribosomal protein L29
MKATEHLKKVRDMSAEELKRQNVEMNEEIFRLRFQLAMGQTESLKRMRELRRERARVETILREKAKGK